MRRFLSALLAAMLIGALLLSVPAAAKKCKKKKCKPKVCATFVPGELGADGPLVTLTDAATAEAPVEQTVTLEQSISDATLGGTDASTTYFNVQVDSAAPSAGLYATFEFPDRRDYDLYLRWEDASEAASSHGFNTLVEAKTGEDFDVSNTSSNHAGESTSSSENIIGVITPDCGGYTVEVSNYLGEGGEMPVKLWLGEGTEEPLAPGEVPAA